MSWKKFGPWIILYPTTHNNDFLNLLLLKSLLLTTLKIPQNYSRCLGKRNESGWVLSRFTISACFTVPPWIGAFPWSFLFPRPINSPTSDSFHLLQTVRVRFRSKCLRSCRGKSHESHRIVYSLLSSVCSLILVLIDVDGLRLPPSPLVGLTKRADKSLRNLLWKFIDIKLQSCCPWCEQRFLHYSRSEVKRKRNFKKYLLRENNNIKIW